MFTISRTKVNVVLYGCMCLIMNLKPADILVLLLQFRNVLSSTLEEGSPCVLKDGSEGICLRLSDCYHAKEDLKKIVLPKFCSLNIWTPTVCCRDCRFIQDRLFDGISIKVSFNFQLEVTIRDSGNVNHDLQEYKRIECLEKFLERFPCNKYEKFKDLDESVLCYDSPHITDKVVAEDHATKNNEYPHLALIGCGDDPVHAHWICTGAIISDKYILIAAHCASSPVLGEIKFAAMGILKQTDFNRNWQIYDVVKIIVHPDYKPPSTYHDIALLETGLKIRYNHDVIPACLHRGEDVAEVATATGWGAMGHPQTLAEILKGADINKLSNEECMEAYPKHRNLKSGYNSTTQVCYGDEERINDTCEGDSGGPLQIKTNEKKSKCFNTIIGVTSYGRACGHFGSSGMFTRVDHYVPWIESIIKGNLS